MAVDKEILAKIEAKQKEKELKAALKEVKSGKKKKALETLIWIMQTGFKAIKCTVVKLAKGISFIFKGINSFRQAVNIHIEAKIEKDAPTKSDKLRRLYNGSVAVSVAIGLFAGVLLGTNIKDGNISIKKTVGESVVQASEMTEENARIINNSQQDSNKETSQKQARTEKNIIEDEELYLLGDVTTSFELGKENKGAIVNTKNGETKYGQFTSDTTKEDNVIEFLLYLRENHNGMYTEWFSSVGNIGTETFNTGWTKASENNKFNNTQVEYKWNKLVKPVVDDIKKEFNVDLNGSLALQEMSYSTVSQYGTTKTTEIFRNANLSKDMSEIEVINAIQDEKEKSLGQYTYTNEESYDDAYREIIRTRINNERIELSRLLGKPAQIIK